MVISLTVHCKCIIGARRNNRIDTAGLCLIDWAECDPQRGAAPVAKTGFLDGPPATGTFADASLALFISFVVSPIAYGLYLTQCRERQ